MDTVSKEEKILVIRSEVEKLLKAFNDNLIDIDGVITDHGELIITDEGKGVRSPFKSLRIDYQVIDTDFDKCEGV